MAFAGEDLSEYFDADDFDDCYEVEYKPIGGVPVTTTLFLTEMSGTLDDGTVRSTYFEVEINRQEVSNPKNKDTFYVEEKLETYEIVSITKMDNDIAHCEAHKVGGP